MKKIKEVHDLLKDKDFASKIKMFFSTKTEGADFDSYEKTYEYTNLNPKTIYGIVNFISPEALVWKKYGLAEIGAVEVITEAKYENWFRTCNKIEIDGDEYSVFKDAGGMKFIIEKRRNSMLRIVLQRK